MTETKTPSQKIHSLLWQLENQIYESRANIRRINEEIEHLKYSLDQAESYKDDLILAVRAYVEHKSKKD